jgi:hypothetical protein
MKLDLLLKVLFCAFLVALSLTIFSWITSERSPARADAPAAGGAGMGTNGWIVVGSNLGHTGDGMIYVLDTNRETLMVYAYYRRAGLARGGNRFDGDLEFLAGRHVKWDSLFSAQHVYPYAMQKRRLPRHDVYMPDQIKNELLKRRDEAEKKGRSDRQ